MCDIVGGREKFQAQSILIASIYNRSHDCRFIKAFPIFFSILFLSNLNVDYKITITAKVIANGDVLEAQHENERNRNIRYSLWLMFEERKHLDDSHRHWRLQA